MAQAAGTGTAPTVSVVIPVYNGVACIARAVASVLQQEYPVREIILIDDGSTDGSPARLRELAAANPSIQVHTNPRNLGLSATLNWALGAASGELVLILHQDCALVGSGWISRAVRWFEDPAVFSVVGRLSHQLGRMPPLERELWVIRAHTMDDGEESSGGFRLTLFSENKCDMFRRGPFLRLGGFDTHLTRGGEDQVLAWRLRQTNFIIARDPELRYEISLGSDRRIGAHLRRDAAYGTQMRQVLRATRFGALTRTSGAPLDPRLVNRASGIGWQAAAIVGLGLLAWTRSPWALLLIGIPPFARWVQLTVRGARQRVRYRLGTGALLSLGVLGLLVDVAYAIGFVLPARRSSA